MIDFHTTYADGPSAPIVRPAAFVSIEQTEIVQMAQLATQFTVNGVSATAPGLYAIVQRVSDGQVWNGTAFEAVDANRWTLYGLAFDNKGLTMWSLIVPHAALPIGGDYAFKLYEQMGETRSPDDRPADTRTKHAWGVAGGDGTLGNTPTDHNTGGTDALRIVDGSGAGVDGASIRAYLADEFATNAAGAPLRGQSETLADGRWSRPIVRDASLAYVLMIHAPGRPASTRIVEGTA